METVSPKLERWTPVVYGQCMYLFPNWKVWSGQLGKAVRTTHQAGTWCTATLTQIPSTSNCSKQHTPPHIYAFVLQLVQCCAMQSTVSRIMAVAGCTLLHVALMWGMSATRSHWYHITHFLTNICCSLHAKSGHSLPINYKSFLWQIYIYQITYKSSY